jgi:hypothetical protein
MSRFSALFTARKRPDDPPSAAAAEAIPPSSELTPSDSPQRELVDNVFSLTPPEPAPGASRSAGAAADLPSGEADGAAPTKRGGNIHQLATADLSRLSIDNDGRLYWDGKPVEVRRRLEMTRAQMVGLGIVAVFIAIGAIGAAIQGSLALRDWGCRLGWTADYCGVPPVTPRRPDIPA